MKIILAILCFAVAAAAEHAGIQWADKRNHSDFDNCLFKGCAESGILEGDIVVSKFNYKETSERYGFQPKVRRTRAAMRKNYRQWPKSGNFVTIPYTFQTKTITQRKRRAILRGIADYRKKTCIRFVPRSKEKRYIEFRGSRGCQSYVGMLPMRAQPQPVWIGFNCEHKGIVIHELMHTLGFYHEQSRSDRDKYVKIQWNNIIEVFKPAFRKERATRSFGSPYDTKSVMHYHSYLYSKNRKPTITNLKGKRIRTQQRNFSVQDLIQINKKYQCKVPAKRPSTGNRNCKDKRTECPSWKSRCKNMRSFMKINCPKTCGFKCDPVTTAKPRTTASPRGKACNDKISGCPLLKRRHYCLNAKTYMRKNCAKTCRFCRITGPVATARPTKRPKTTASPRGRTCINKLASCSTLKKKNYCTISKTFMRKNCPQICGFCRKYGPVTTAPPTRRPRITTRPQTTAEPKGKSCEDKLSTCTRLKKRHHCVISKSYMRKNCGPTCGFCRKSEPAERTTTKVQTTTPAPKRTTPAKKTERTTTKVLTTTPAPKLTTPSKQSCKDSTPSCRIWKKREHCNKKNLEKIMRKNCARSCNFCVEVTSTTVQPSISPQTTPTSQKSARPTRTTIAAKTVMSSTRQAATTKSATTKPTTIKASTPKAATTKAASSTASSVVTDVFTSNTETSPKATDANPATVIESTTTSYLLTNATSTASITKQAPCRDTMRNCSNYAKSGMCTREHYKNWMSGKCRKSCKLCTRT